jgi:hypothetical protein
VIEAPDRPRLARWVYWAIRVPLIPWLGRSGTGMMTCAGPLRRRFPSWGSCDGGRSFKATGRIIANICMWLKRNLKDDPVKEEFVNDPAANRLRSRAIREPWSAYRRTYLTSNSFTASSPETHSLTRIWHLPGGAVSGRRKGMIRRPDSIR